MLKTSKFFQRNFHFLQLEKICILHGQVIVMYNWLKDLPPILNVFLAPGPDM